MPNQNSNIYICNNVRVTNSYEHTIYFSDINKQKEYFTGKVVKTFSGVSYLRKNWKIKVEECMGNARTWTYLFFNNPSTQDSKTYYYFITNIEYINDCTVELSLELDVMQTYMFDYSLLDCFVEREHAMSDAIGEHTLEEGLELGDLRNYKTYNINWDGYACLILARTNIQMLTEEDHKDVGGPLGHKMDNIFSGLYVYAVDMNNSADVLNFSAKLSQVVEWGVSDYIFAMWMYPKTLITLSGDAVWGEGVWCKEVHGVKKSNSFAYPIEYNHGGYTPKNNKLNCYPYNFCYVTNNMGMAATYKFEYWYNNNSEVRFSVKGCISPDGSVALNPKQYNNLTDNTDEAITLSGFPMCAWLSDTYKMWLAQNQNQSALSTATGVATIVGGIGTTIGSIYTGNLPGAAVGVGMVASGASSIANTMAQKKDNAVQPPQARGTFSNTVNMANNNLTFNILYKCIDKQHAQAIDNYFTMYGYKCHRVKMPNRSVRENFTYTKTIGCCIRGNLCAEDRAKIESVYNNGVTFWMDGDKIGNYSLTNGTLYA